MRRTVACVALFVALASQRGAGQDATDIQAVMRRVELLEAVQLRVLRELESISTQLAELRKGAPPPGPARVSPPPPAIPSAMQNVSDAAIKGSNDAEIVLIEYADFQCPYCGQFSRQILPEIEKRYVNTGKIRMVFKHMPLQEIHPQAMMAAEAAECARQQGKFWEMHNALFQDQKLDETALVEKARTSGLDIKAFSTCVRGEGGAKVRQDIAAARALGLNVTPTFLLGKSVGDGRVKVEQILTGLRGIDVFAAAIDPLVNAPSGK